MSGLLDAASAVYAAVHEWVPAITSTTGLAVIGFLLSVPYRKSIEGKIGRRFDEKLERTKADLRRDEERLRAELKERGEEISALRSGALSSLSARHAELGRRRIVAVDAIWNAVMGLSKHKTLALLTKSINMDVAIREAARKDTTGANTRRFADGIWTAFKMDDLSQDQPADAHRPFVPQVAWAFFSAYRTIVLHSTVQFVVFKTGVGGDKLAKADEVIALAKSVLPGKSKFIEEYGTGSFPFLIEELEENLLTILVDTLGQNDFDQSSIVKAAEIVAFASKVGSGRSPSVEVPANLSRNAPETR